MPFLRCCLDAFEIIPLLTRDVPFGRVAEVLEKLWGDECTLLVVSSDLSHFHNYAAAQQLDKSTSKAIETLEPTLISEEGACGRTAIKALLMCAK